MTANLKTIYPYSDIANFKNTNTIVENGKALLDTPLKDTRPLVIDFEKGLAPLVGAVKTFEVVGGADADANWLDVKGDAVRGVRYPLTANLGAYVDQFTMRMKFKPSFTSGSNNNIYCLLDIQDNLGTSRISLLYNNNSKELYAHVTNDAGGVLASLKGVWDFAAGVTYEIELNQNYQTDSMVVFVDGIYKFHTVTSTVVRDFTDHFLVLGTFSSARYANHEIKDFEFFSTLLRPGTDTFNSEIPRTIEKGYALEGEICAYATILTDKLVSITPTVVNTLATSTSYILNVDGVDKYFNGTSWVDATTGQVNTLAEINANTVTLDLAQGVVLIVKIILKGDGYETPELDELLVEYSFYRSYVEGKTTLVYGQLKNADGSPMANTKIKVTKSRHIKQGDALILNKPIEKMTNSEGTFALSLVETETVNQVVEIEIADNDDESKNTTFKGIKILDRETVKLTELIQ